MHNNILVDFRQVKIDSEPIDHLRLIVLNIVVHDSLELGVGNVLDSAMFDEFGKSSVEYFLRTLVAELIISLAVGKWDEGGYYLVLNDLNKKTNT